MSKRMDWVPCYQWGVPQTVTAITQLDLPLMDFNLFDAADVVGRVDESPGRYFIHRIVGQFSMRYATLPGTPQPIHATIWPGLIESTTAANTVHTPGFVDEDEGQNPELWWHRVMGTALTVRYGDIRENVDFAWRMVDIRPRREMSDGRIPVFSIYNDVGSEDLIVEHWFRMLVTPLG